jgi:hypothetical protein
MRNEKRLFSAFNLFTQVAIGMVSSSQMAVMGLFAALECLFVPKGNYAQTLATRVSRFLSSFHFPSGISEWLEHEYIQGRSKLIHGVPDMHPSGKRPAQGGQRTEERMVTTRTVTFGRLHELVRLSVLGFLCLLDQIIKDHSSRSGTHLQNLIGHLGPATGRLIAGQTAWCD